MNVELRKAKKEDHLLKRRNLEIDDEPLSPLQEQNRMAAANMSIEDIVNGMHVTVLFLLHFFSHVIHYHSGINSGDENKEITATHAARKILSRERNPPIDILINANVVPKLVEFLSRVNKYV